MMVQHITPMFLACETASTGDVPRHLHKDQLRSVCDGASHLTKTLLSMTTNMQDCRSEKSPGSQHAARASLAQLFTSG